MPAFCEQEQNKYTTKMREYSVYGMVKVNLIYVDSCQTQDGGQNECDDVAKTAAFELHKSSVQHSTLHCDPISLH